MIIIIFVIDLRAELNGRGQLQSARIQNTTQICGQKQTYIQRGKKVNQLKLSRFKHKLSRILVIIIIQFNSIQFNSIQFNSLLFMC
jgi:hypothetical protein